MVVSYNWLKEYLHIDLDAQKVGEILTSIGLEVEHISEKKQIAGSLDQVVVAYVLECEEHPNSDHLHVTMVDAGEAEPIQIVCGAPNVAKGQKVLLAKVGAKLTTIEGDEIKIKRSKIRGVESFGMICAEDELGIGVSHDGIMVLEDDAVVGTPAEEYLQLESDTIFEIGLTPNRVDAASHLGVARDLYAYLKLNNIPATLTLPSVEDFQEGEGEAIPIKVQDVEGSPRYIGITISDVTVGQSPQWLQDKLIAIGMRPINSVVDITNFVLHETGQPLHAFDAAKIKGRKVVIRRAEDNTPFVTLDGIERKLTDKDLMICNTEEPMCIAGVFGGLDSGVTEETKEIFLECAYFNPVTVRKTAKRFALSTDSSFRFERGTDPHALPYVAKRAALLIQDLTGGKITGKIQESYPEEIKCKEIELNFDSMRSLIGKAIDNQTFIDILNYLEFEFVSQSDNSAVVKVPAYRVDVYRECDVVEEVLRIYGYNNIELPTSMKVSVNTFPKPDPETVRVEISNFLSHNGFVETMNNSLTKSDYYKNLTTYKEENLVPIMNPLSSDLNVMRQTLLFNALEVIAYNINRQSNYLKIYELGNVYSYNPVEENPASNLKSYNEEMRLSIFMSGNSPKNWCGNCVQSNFFLLKGYLELLLKRFGINPYNLESKCAPTDLFSEGIEYLFNGKTLAVMGTISPKLAKRFGIKQSVYGAEINFQPLFKLIKKNNVKYQELPKYPEVRRDLALVIDENVSYSELRKAALQCEKRLIKQVSLFDVYRGDKLPEGKKQYAINFVLQDLEKTLTDGAVEFTMNKLIKMFEEKFGAVLR